MTHLPIPTVRTVALGVALLTTSLIRAEAAEATLIVEADSARCCTPSTPPIRGIRPPPPS